MTVKIKPKFSKWITYNHVWELQDNDGTFIVVKYSSHECKFIEKKIISKIVVEA